jgi:hypothetical protein
VKKSRSRQLGGSKKGRQYGRLVAPKLLFGEGLLCLAAANKLMPTPSRRSLVRLRWSKPDVTA